MFTLGDLILNLYIFIYGLLVALFMTSVEGKSGWGGSSEWEISKVKWYAIFFKAFAWGRPLKLFPIIGVFTFTFSFLLLPAWYFSKGLTFSIPNLAELIAYFIIFAIHEDFLWFLVNPYYGIKKFKKEHVLWHPHWWFGLPKEYWIGTIAFFIFGVYSRGLIWSVLVFSLQLVLGLLSILISLKITRSIDS